MSTLDLPASVTPSSRFLSIADFGRLADVPLETPNDSPARAGSVGAMGRYAANAKSASIESRLLMSRSNRP